MRAKKTSGALMTSLILHGVAVLILGIFLVTQTPHFKDLVGAEVLNPPDPPKPTVRKQPIKQIKPANSTDNTVVVEPVKVQPELQLQRLFARLPSSRKRCSNSRIHPSG